MRNRFSCPLGWAFLAAFVALPAAAQEYSNGGKGASGRGPAILTPVEAFGVHPPGTDPADANRWRFRLRQRYIPYYAPLSPVASTARWAPMAYHPLLAYYTPYYPGYCPHRLFNPPPKPYGSNGWGAGPKPEIPLPEEPGTTPLGYDGYTSVIEDDTMFWNMGGNGLVPYGDLPPETGRPPDLVDAIEASRPHGHRHAHFVREAPAVEQEQEQERSNRRRSKNPEESIPPGDASPEQEDGAGANRSSRQTKPAAPKLRIVQRP